MGTYSSIYFEDIPTSEIPHFYTLLHMVLPQVCIARVDFRHHDGCPAIGTEGTGMPSCTCGQVDCLVWLEDGSSWEIDDELITSLGMKEMEAT